MCINFKLASPSHWLDVNNSEVPLVDISTGDMEFTPLGTHRLTTQMNTTDRLCMMLVSIVPPDLVHPLLASTFLSPANAWCLLATRVESLGHGLRVDPFMDWIWSCTVAPTRTSNHLSRSYLTVSTLNQRQDIMKQLALSPAPFGSLVSFMT